MHAGRLACLHMSVRVVHGRDAALCPPHPPHPLAACTTLKASAGSAAQRRLPSPHQHWHSPTRDAITSGGEQKSPACSL